jgi:hypothetical protein
MSAGAPHGSGLSVMVAQQPDGATAVSQGTQPAPSTLKIGPLTVRATAQEVATFRAETFAPADEAVPFTFPMRWFARPDIRAAAESLLGDEPSIPLHESQSFDYLSPLAIDTDYQMTVDITREYEPQRVILRAEIGRETIFLRSEMILRIIPASAIASGV